MMAARGAPTLRTEVGYGGPRLLKAGAGAGDMGP
jgi:hypothetical protein